MNKPLTLDIRAENGHLVGTDEEGRTWVIRWVGNGAYSHWNLSPTEDLGLVRYLYIYSNNEYDKALEAQIRDAEHKYQIYG